jgi:hypothetical protein
MNTKSISSLVFSGLLVLGAATGVALSAAPAHADGDILSKAVNDPSRVWYVFGTLGKSELIKDQTVAGGTAERITVSAKGANIWDAGGMVATVKPIQQGDVLLLAFWAKAETPPPGDSTIQISAQIQESAAPYTPQSAFVPISLTPKWKMYYVKGVAIKDYKKGEISGAINFATGVEVFDTGPILLIDFGPGYDMSKLPSN